MHICRKCAEKYAISDKCINIENRTENCTEVEYVNKWSMSGTLLGICIFLLFLTAEFFGIYVLTVTIPTIERNIIVDGRDSNCTSMVVWGCVPSKRQLYHCAAATTKYYGCIATHNKSSRWLRE